MYKKLKQDHHTASKQRDLVERKNDLPDQIDRILLFRDTQNRQNDHHKSRQQDYKPILMIHSEADRMDHDPCKKQHFFNIHQACAYMKKAVDSPQILAEQKHGIDHRPDLDILFLDIHKGSA